MKLKLISLLFMCYFVNFAYAQQHIEGSLLTQAEKYLNGTGVPKDEKKAFSLYLQAALNGNITAMNRVAVLYNEGIGTTANKASAMQWFLKSGERGYAKGFYNLAKMYKDGKGKEQSFEKAIMYFTKAADMNDPESMHAKGYMLYKGLGCRQSYTGAVQCFRQAAGNGLANSMYFLGLCFRNGYGINANKDSAAYWLQKAAHKGEAMAYQELIAVDPENNDAQLTSFAAGLKQKTIKTDGHAANRVEKINNSIEAGVIEGKYTGYIIKYDWSNQHALTVTPLHLELNYKDNVLSGYWQEAEQSAIPMQASLTATKMVFSNTSYKRTGHYNPTIALPYSFRDANVQWQKINDSITLSGTIQMFSNDANEPQKPQYIYLTKYESTTNRSAIQLVNDDGTPLKAISRLSVYPNPFSTNINLEFENKVAQKVSVILLTSTGKEVYNNDLGTLETGSYKINIVPEQYLPTGLYFVRLKFNNNIKSVKIVKL